MDEKLKQMVDHRLEGSMRIARLRAAEDQARLSRLLDARLLGIRPGTTQQ